MLAVEGKLSPRILGGNGIAAGTVNYPGAAAHTGSGRSGFRGVEEVFSSRYAAPLNVNAAILQDNYGAGVIQPNSRLYYLQDANWDTTAVVMPNPGTGVWGVAQRYVYSPYGSIVVLNADWSTPPAGTQPLVNNLYQGMTLDAVTGLYYERFRNYSPSLGTWISQDPSQYINGADTYQFVGSGPVGATDPLGKFCWSCFWAGVDFTEMAVDMVATVATTTAELDAAYSVPEAGPAIPEDALATEALLAGALSFADREYHNIRQLITDAEACEKCDPCKKPSMEKDIKAAEDNKDRVDEFGDKIREAIHAMQELLRHAE